MSVLLGNPQPITNPHSSNGKTSLFGSDYRGSNPWWGAVDNNLEIPYNRSMRKQLIRDSIIIGGLIAAILFLFVVAIPFVMSNDFIELAVNIFGR